MYKARERSIKLQRLYDYLHNVKPSLLRLASIPIRLEKMCIVWSFREDLGEQLVDLYIMFVKYLLDRLEQKMSILKRTPENVILDKYEDLLMSVASLANNWDGFNRFKAIMSYSDLEECLG